MTPATIEPRTRWSALPWLALALAVAALAAFALPVSAMFEMVPRNYNEGWNAYHIADLIAGRELYPAEGSFTENNYPPLSFYVEALVTLAVGDAIFATRLTAFACQLITGLNVGLVAWSLTGRRDHGLLVGLFFLAFTAVAFSDYTAMADPQWLGHAFQTTGLAILLRGLRRGSERVATIDAVACAAFLVAGGFVKHNLIGLPAACGLWLLVYDRRAFLSFCAGAAIALLAGAGLTWLLHGTRAFAAILFHARGMSGERLLFNLPNFLITAGPFLLFSLPLLILDGRNRHSVLPLLFLALASAISLFSLLGEGISTNAYFDAVLAGSLVAARLALRLSDYVAPEYRSNARCVALALMAATMLGNMPNFLAIRAMTLRQVESRPVAAETIARIAAVEGPVACDVSAWCYWAGKPNELDFFNFGQRIQTGRADPAPLLHRIETRHYAAFVFNGARHGHYFGGVPVIDTILRSYHDTAPSGGTEILIPSPAVGGATR